jgi:thioredoxin-related protein
MKKYGIILFLLLSGVCFSQTKQIVFELGNLESVLQKAAKENKLIFIDAYTTWCGPCKKMSKEVFTTDTVANYFNRTFVNYKFDMEKGEGIEFAKKYNVNCYPNLLVIDSKGTVIHRGAGYMKPMEFIAFAKASFSSDENFIGKKNYYENTSLNEKTIIEYISLMEGACLDPSAAVTKYLQTAKEEELVNTTNWVLIRDNVTNIDSREIKYLLNHTNGVFDILYLQKHKKFVALGGDGSFSVWNSLTYLCELTQKLCDAKLRSADIDISENEIAIACGDNSVRIFNIETWTELQRLNNHSLSANVVKYHPNGQYLLTGSRDAHLNIYNVKGYSLVKSIPAHNFAIYGIAFNADNSLFATASRDKTAKIWDATTFEIKVRISKENNEGHLNSVNKVLWADKYLITTGDDRAIIIWEAE